MAKAKYPISNEFFPFNKFAPPMSRRFVQLAQMGMKTPKLLWKDPQLAVQSRMVPGYQDDEIEVFILTPKGLTEPPSYNNHRIPVVFILTSNAPAEYYADLAKRYKGSLEAFIGPTQTFVSGNTLQVNDYEKYDWTMFNTNEKKERREMVFPRERQAVFELGASFLNK